MPLPEDLRKPIRLSAEQEADLRFLEGPIKEAERAIERMKRLDMDTSILESKLTLAKTYRDIMLKEFTG